MTLGFYLLENFHDDSLLIDDESGAQNSLVGEPVHLLFAVHAIGVSDFMAFVGQKGKRQLELCLELLV